MLCILYCHDVRSEDDRRTSAYLSSANGGASVEITITAPFEAYDVDEALRGGFRYRLRWERLDDKE